MKSREAFENAKLFLNEINLQDVKKESKNSMESICALEKTYSIMQLKKLLNNVLTNLDEKTAPSHFKPLEEFLAARWERIRHTDLAYTHAERDPLTAVCLSIAQALADPLKKSAYELLMPTIDLDVSELQELKPLKDRLCDNELQLHHFVLSDDDTRIIEILPCLDFSEEEGELKHTTLFGEPPQAKALSPEECKRVINHSTESLEYYQAIQAVIKIKKLDKSKGAYIQRLIDQLRKGGAHGGNGGKELVATHDADVGIVEFQQFLELLPSNEKEQLFKLSAPGISDTIEILWGRLARPNTKEYLAVRYCVELIANSLEKILENNQQLFNENILKENENLRLRKKNTLEKYLKGFRYTIKPFYLEDGEKHLLNQLITIFNSAGLADNLKILFSLIDIKTWPDLKDFIKTPQLLGLLISSMNSAEILEKWVAKEIDFIKHLLNTETALQDFLTHCEASKNQKIHATILRECGNEILFNAFSTGNISVVKQMIEAGVSPTEMRSTCTSGVANESVLKIAIQNKNWKMVSIMLQVDPEETEEKGWTASHIIARQNRVDLVPLLVEEKLLDSRDRYHNTAAHIAVDFDNVSMIKALGEASANLNMLNLYGSTPAYFAVRDNHDIDVIKELIKQGAAFDYAPVSPIKLVVQQQKLDLLAIILRVDPIQVTEEKLSAANIFAYSKRTDLLKLALEAKVDLNETNECGQTTAHLAVLADNTVFIRAFANSYVNFNIRSNYGRTPLHLAVELNKLDVVAAFGSSHTDFNFNIPDSNGESPVYIAAKKGYTSVLRMLAELKADLNSSSPTSLATVVMSQGDSPHAIRTLIEFKANCSDVMHVAVAKNRLKIIEELIRLNFDIDKPDESGRTPLDIAITQGNKEIVAVLLGYKQRFGEVESIPHMILFSGRPELIKLLVKNPRYDIDDVYSYGPYGAYSTLAHTAVKNNLINMVKALIENKADFTKFHCGLAPVHEVRSPEMLDVFATHSMDMMLPDRAGNTLATYLFSNKYGTGKLTLERLTTYPQVDFFRTNKVGNSQIVCAINQEVSKEIVAAMFKVDPSQRIAMNWTALHLAAMQGRVNETKALLMHRCCAPQWAHIDYYYDINAVDKEGNTPAHLAVIHNHSHIIELLITFHANLRLRNDNNKTVAMLAIEKNRPEIVSQLFWSWEARSSIPHFLVKTKQDELIKYLDKHNEDIDKPDNQGLTPAQWAVQMNNSKAVEELTEFKIDWTRKDKTGATMLESAFKQNSGSLLKALHRCRIDFHEMDSDKNTLVHKAVMEDKLEVLKTLCELKVDLNVKNAKHLTPLQIALVENKMVLFSILIGYGANIHITDEDDLTLLHAAVSLNNAEAVNMLVNAKADINKSAGILNKTPLELAIDNKQWGLIRNLANEKDISKSPAHIAAAKNYVELMRALAEDKMDLNNVDKDDNTPLSLAVSSHSVEIIKIIGKSRVNFNIPDKKGNASIHEAVLANDLDVVRELIRNNANPNLANSEGCSPLHLAVKKNQLDMAKLLIEMNGDLSQTTSNQAKETATHIAAKAGNVHMFQELLRYPVYLNVRDGDGKKLLNIALDMKNWSMTALTLLAMPGYDVLSAAELKLIKANRKEITAAFIAAAKLMHPVSRMVAVNGVMEQRNMLGIILSIPKHSTLHFFQKGSHQGRTEKIYQIGKEFGYFEKSQEFKKLV